MDDFYAIIPSNSSIGNTPAKFLNTFDRPIYLENVNDWEVGLVELNFKNSIKTINQDYAIIEELNIYDHQKVSGDFKFSEPIKQITLKEEASRWKIKEWITVEKTDQLEITLKDYSDFKIYCKEGKFVVENMSKFAITLSFPKKIAMFLGFLDHDQSNISSLNDVYIKLPKIKAGDTLLASNDYTSFKTNGKEYIVLYPAAIFGDDYFLEIVCTYESFTTVKNIQVTPRTGTYTSAKELEIEMNKSEEFKTYFEFAYDERLNRMDIISKVRDDVYSKNGYTKRIERRLFLKNGLHDVIGFNSNKFSFNKDSQKGDMEISLQRGITSLFIYCDLCEPIRVGNTISPLLRNVAFNTRKYGEMVHINYVNPMYVKVNKTFIDTVEIMIYDASGELVPFVEGLTTVTLHFKRI